MKKYLVFQGIILLLFLTSLNAISQTKHFTLNVQQPPAEQCLVAVPNIPTDGQLKIFPNPTQGEVTISIGTYPDNAKAKIQVFSADGKSLLSFDEYPENNSLQKKVDLSSLNKGIYLIKLTGLRFVAVQRVVLI
jgi:hypothetical protein